MKHLIIPAIVRMEGGMVVAKSHSQRGYTLIEMSISLSILALLIVGGVSVLQRRIEIDSEKTTIKHMDAIERAIQDFVALNGYIPCPARGTSLEINNTQGTFGFSNTSYQNATTQLCDGDSVTNETGMVPVRTLNLPDEYAYDGWKHKFTYRIAQGMGDVNTFLDIGNRGNISITDLTGNEKTNINQRTPGYRAYDQGAAYILISHGPNGGGAWLKNASGTVAAPTSMYELENTDHADNRRYIQSSEASSIDDIVRYKRKMDILDHLNRQSPLDIPSTTCGNARIIGDAGIPPMTDTTLATHTYLAARMVDMLCQSPPDRCEETPYYVSNANLILWLDGADPSNNDSPPSNNTQISTWTDKSPAGNNATESASRRPRFRTSSPFTTASDTNGKSALEFDGSNDYMAVDISALNGSEYTIFVMMARSSNTTNQFAIGTLSTTLNEGLSVGYGPNSGSNPLYQIGQSSNDLNLPGKPFDSPKPVLLVAEFNNSGTASLRGHYLYVHARDGAIYKVSNTNTNPLTNIPSGNTDGTSGAIGRALGSDYLEGYIAEILVYNTALNAIQRSAIEGYLKRRWFSGECP